MTEKYHFYERNYLRKFIFLLN